MPIRFTPDGLLDVSTDPLNLPQQSDGKNVVSGAMTRCLNLALDEKGKAKTRLGSHRESTQLATPIWGFEWAENSRYEFAGANCYKDSTLIGWGMTSAQWSTLTYKAYNSSVQNIFGVNGTDRKRISGSTVWEWGVDPPSVAPVLSGDVPVVYSFSWESTTGKWLDYTGDNTIAYQQTWEEDHADDSAVSFYNVQLADADRYCNGENQYVAAYQWEAYDYDATLMSYGLLSDMYNIRKFTEYEATQQTDYLQSWEETQLQGGVAYYDNPYDYVWMWWNEVGGTADQNFSVKYTLCRKYGDLLEFESNPSPASSIEPVMGACYVTWTTPSDSQITHVRIYRTVAGGSDYYYAAEFDVSDLKGAVAVADEELGSLVATDHDRPPLGTLVFGPSYDGTLFMTVGNLLYYSKPKQPEYWPALYFLEVCSPTETISAGCYYQGVLYLATEADLYTVTGTSATSFFPLPLNTGMGTRAAKCMKASRATGVVRLASDGLYQYTGGRDITISDPFSLIFQGENSGAMPGMQRSLMTNCWMVQRGEKLYFGYPSSALSVYPDNIIVYDLTSKRQMHYQYPVAFSSVAYDVTNDRIIAGDSNGYVWWLEQLDHTDDNGTVIDWDLETKEFGGLRKYFPRFARYDVMVNGSTVNAHVKLDGLVKQTHPLTADRATKKRLIAGCTGDRLSMRLSGTGQVEIHSMEIE